MITFDSVFEHLLDDEGGYVNHPSDRGGPTNMGVTQKTYTQWRKKKGLPAQNVRLITRAEVYEIYRQYWDDVKADELPERLRYMVFDVSVNSGPKRAIKLLQQAAGVRADGALGPVTLGVLDRVSMSDYSKQREMWYKKIVENDKSQLDFYAGWMKRVAKVHNRSITLLNYIPGD